MTVIGPRSPDQPQTPLGLYIPNAPEADGPLSAFENPRIVHPEEVEGNDWDTIDAQEAAFLRAHPEEAERQSKLKRHAPRFILAEGGPYDGMEMMVPPKVAQIVRPGAFGVGDYSGPVIYKREKRPGGDRMVFAGTPDQTDEDHTDPPED